MALSAFPDNPKEVARIVFSILLVDSAGRFPCPLSIRAQNEAPAGYPPLSASHARHRFRLIWQFHNIPMLIVKDLQILFQLFDLSEARARAVGRSSPAALKCSRPLRSTSP